MSTLLQNPAGDDPASARRAFSWPRWMREPLLHFLIIGAVIFAVDYARTGRVDDQRTILIDAAVDSEAIKVFKAARGREPNDDELYALRKVWLDNEVLYREGIALQLDRGDKAIRERVIFKALSIINAGIKAPPFDDKTLRDYFERQRAKYDEPARYDFQEAVVAGESTEANVRALVRVLNKGSGGELDAGLRVFKGRPYANIEQGYGAEFARAIEQSAPGEWRAYPTKEGWRAMRLDAVTPAKPAVFEAFRGVVLQDWTDVQMTEQRTAAVRALAKKYTVRYEPEK